MASNREVMTKYKEKKCIVFVNPPISSQERYGKLRAGANNLPPLGLCHLAAVTRENAFYTKIVDCVALKLDYEDAISNIIYYNPKFIGITAATISIFNAAILAEKIKGKDKSIVIIIGGPHITAVPEETMLKFPQFDVGVIGEGEVTIIDLLKTYNDGGKLEKVKGIVYREDGEIKKTNPREVIRNLDSLPMPAWDLLPNLPRYYRSSAQNIKTIPSSSIVTSRGCPGKCIFCDRKVFGNYCRAFSADYVIKIFRKLHHEYGIRDIQIKDDTFTTFKNRLMDICKTLIQGDLNISWSCLARVDHVNPEMLELMRKAGCWQIQYGIESGVQQIIDVYKKGINLQQVQQAIKWTKKSGITSLGFFMIGSPLETEQTIRETIDFAKRLDLDDFRLSFLTPFPGSELYDAASKYGTFEKDWRRLCEYKVNFVPNGLKKELMEKYYRKAYIQFYYRPKIVLSYLRRMRNLDVIIENLKVAYSVLKNFIFGR